MMEDRKERLDEGLKWAIWIYAGLCLFGIIAKAFTLTGGLFSLLHALTLSNCVYGGLNFSDYCIGSYYEYLVLLALVAVRYIMFGKTYQK